MSQSFQIRYKHLDYQYTTSLKKMCGIREVGVALSIQRHYNCRISGERRAKVSKKSTKISVISTQQPTKCGRIGEVGVASCFLSKERRDRRSGRAPPVQRHYRSRHLENGKNGSFQIRYKHFDYQYTTSEKIWSKLEKWA